MPFVVSGDWNLTPEEVISTGWTDTLGADIVAPSLATCVRGASRTLDWFVVSRGLHYGSSVRLLTAVGTKDHKPVQIELKSSRVEALIHDGSDPDTIWQSFASVMEQEFLEIYQIDGNDSNPYIGRARELRVQ
ncbi:unnamed protein product, partial [Prorocentrum cordatum]